MKERQRERQRRTSQRAGQEKKPKERKNGRELESNTRTLGWRGTIWNLKQGPCPGAFRRDRAKKSRNVHTENAPCQTKKECQGGSWQEKQKIHSKGLAGKTGKKIDAKDIKMGRKGRNTATQKMTGLKGKGGWRMFEQSKFQ